MACGHLVAVNCVRHTVAGIKHVGYLRPEAEGQNSLDSSVQGGQVDRLEHDRHRDSRCASRGVPIVDSLRSTSSTIPSMLWEWPLIDLCEETKSSNIVATSGRADQRGCLSDSPRRRVRCQPW